MSRTDRTRLISQSNLSKETAKLSETLENCHNFGNITHSEIGTMGPFARRNLRFALCVVGAVLLFGAGFVKSHDEDLDDEGFEGEAASVVATSGEDEYDVKYDSPMVSGDYFLAEHFDDSDASKKKWIVSRAHKVEGEQEDVFKYEGKWDFEFPQKRLFPNDKSLVMKSKAKHHAISAKLDRPFEFKDKPFIIQYEVNFQNGMDCGGAYVKLLSHSKDMQLETFNDKTPYTIMFGPDKCGSDLKVHFIFRHKNPINGTFSEKHAKRPSNRLDDTYSDKKPHLYRLKVTPDSKFEMFVDERLINQGSLLSDMEPQVNPPMEIEDPNDVKPADWDEREKVADMTSKKPDDWDDDAPLKISDPSASSPSGWLEDEPEMVPDPTAVKPDDWDDNMDGSWEAPLINNPKCAAAPGCGPWTAPLIDNPNFRGKWKPPMISNPNYKGKWSRRMIPNPGYFEDKEPFKMTPIGAVGLELWTMSDLVLFDNFIISDDDNVIAEWTRQTWELKHRIYDKDNEGVIRRLINYSNAHPWLWAIYVLLIGLPLVLIFTFCCGSSQDKKINDTQYKKTDETSPDDERNDADLTNAATRRGGSRAPAAPTSSTDEKAPVTMSKEDLEEDSEDAEEEEEVQEVEDESEGEVVEPEEAEPVQEEQPSRRRKGRKE